MIKKIGVLPGPGVGFSKCGESICAAILVLPVRYSFDLRNISQGS